MGVDIKIEGIDELNKILDQLPPYVEKKVVVPGLRNAAKPLLAAMRSKVPVKTGKGKRSIGILVEKGIYPAVLVGPRTGKGVKNDGWALRFMEFGTAARKPRTLGRRALRRGGKQNTKLKFVSNGRTFYVEETKGITPRPFVRPALDETREQIINSLGQHVGESVEKYVAKHGYHKQ